MRVHYLASQPHYAEHIEAVWKHLPDGLRGNRLERGLRVPDTDMVMVASFIDIGKVSPTCPIIYVEHGAGQTYVGAGARGNYYAGGEHPDNVIGYLAPRQQVADLWGRPSFVCGSPVCDPYELSGEDKTIAFTFHWNGRRVCPEAGSAFEHYIVEMPAILELLDERGYTVLGHHHPRFGHLSSAWRNLGVQEVDVDEVRRRAGILIADNTSLLYEMMYLCRRVVALNAPWFRRDVHHGLRFWDHPPTPQVDGPENLMNLIRNEFPDPFGDLALANMTTTRYVYGKPFSDGHDGLRAATWVTQIAAGI